MPTRTSLARWFKARRRPACRRATRPVPADLPAPVDEGPFGCGWFDSSFELRRGLAVVEHGAAEVALAVELMLAGEALGPGAAAR